MSLLLQSIFRTQQLLPSRWMTTMSSHRMLPCVRNPTSQVMTIPPRSPRRVMMSTWTLDTTLPLARRHRSVWQDVLLDWALWLGKRTFQPSIVRKKRKTGFLVRQRTVGGRRVLKRRQAKGRMRLGGGI